MRSWRGHLASGSLCQEKNQLGCVCVITELVLPSRSQIQSLIQVQAARGSRVRAHTLWNASCTVAAHACRKTEKLVHHPGETQRDVKKKRRILVCCNCGSCLQQTRSFGQYDLYVRATARQQTGVSQRATTKQKKQVLLFSSDTTQTTRRTIFFFFTEHVFVFSAKNKLWSDALGICSPQQTEDRRLG